MSKTLALCLADFKDPDHWREICDDLGLVPYESDQTPEVITIKVQSSEVES